MAENREMSEPEQNTAQREEDFLAMKANLQQKADELSALHALSLDIATLQDLPTLLTRIVERAAKLLNTPGGALYLCDPERKEVHLRVENYPVGEQFVGSRLKYGEGAAGKVAQDGLPLVIDDYSTWPERAMVFEASHPYKAVLSVPMVWQGKVSGVLQVLDDENHPFTKDDLELLTLFANQAAIAVENARLFEAERKARERAEALKDAARIIGSSLSLEEVLQAVLEQLVHVLPFDSGSIMLLKGKELVIKIWRGYQNFADQRLIDTVSFDPELDPTVGEVVRSCSPLAIPNVTRDPRWRVTPIGRHIQSWLGVPLLTRERCIGLFSLDRVSPDGFSEDEIKLAQSFALHASTAIENASLYKQSAAERRHLKLLYDINRELATSLDPDEILERAVTLTTQALDGLLGQAFLYVPEEDRLRLWALYGHPGVSMSEMKSKVVLKLGEGLAGWVAQRLEPAYVPDVTLDRRWRHVDRLDDGVRTALCAPISAEGQLLGVLSVLYPQPDAFSPDQLDLLQAICSEIGLALSNARRYQQVGRRLAENTLIQSLAQIFNQRLDLQNLLEEVVQQLASRFSYPKVDIFLVEGERLAQRAYYGTPPMPEAMPLTLGIVGRAARTGIAALVPDVEQDQDYYAYVDGIVSELAVPILRDKTVVGVINIETHIPGQLTAQDCDLLQVLAGQISIALENAVLYERVRRHAGELEVTISRRTAELSELYELSQKIGYTLSYEELLRMLLGHLRKAARSVLAAGGLYFDDYQVQIIEAGGQPGPAAMDMLCSYWREALRQEGKAEQIWREPQVQVRSEPGGPDADYPVPHPEEFMYTPIRSDGKTIGVLIAGSEKNNGFGSEQERLLSTFANQAATAVQRLSAILAEERKRLESLVEHLPVGVLLLDEDHRMLLANALGKDILSILNEGEDGYRLSRLGTTLMDDLIDLRSGTAPVEITTSSPPRIFEVQLRPAGAERRQWVLVLREVTDERENQKRIYMQERLATVGQLAAGIAHDFNNIMAAILVYADLLKGEPSLPEASRNRLGIIQQQVERASSLIRQILDFSRRSVMEQSSLDLLPFIKEMDKMLRRVMPETITLRLSYQPGEYMVRADPTRLQQAFMNLALNSRDAMPKGGLLQFELGRLEVQPGGAPPFAGMHPGRWIRLSVVDNGAGIPAENLPHIFEPFFTTKPVGQGTGLGLAQVYGIVKQHNGFIDFHSQEGKGTTFNIYLPAQQSGHDTREVQEAPVELDGKGKMALVVEDDSATLGALRALLEAQHYQVFTAANGAEALKEHEDKMAWVELVVSDLVMPQMGGLALYRTIAERWPGARMLFVTGHPLDGESQRLLEQGHVSWLQKPFSIQQFNQAVRGLTR